MKVTSRGRYWLGVMLVLALLACPAALAQVSNSYGSYYQKKSRKSGGVAMGTNVNSYLYDKYFEKKSSVSPYMSLSRPRSVSSYYQEVRPEQMRREAARAAGRAYVQDRKLQGNVGKTDYGLARSFQQGVPSANQIPRPKSKAPSSYYNQYYGHK